jgi:hypothetical protein
MSPFDNPGQGAVYRAGDCGDGNCEDKSSTGDVNGGSETRSKNAYVLYIIRSNRFALVI